MTYPVLLGAIVITTANRRLRFREGAGAVGNVDIATGTYYLRGDGSADDLCLAIKTGLDAFGVGGNAYTVTVARSIDPAVAHTLLTTTRTAGTDTFGFVIDGSETFDMALIGFTASTANDATAKTSTQACAAGWVSNDILAELEPFAEREAEVDRAASGSVTGVSFSSHMTSWSLGFAFVHETRALKRRALAVDGDTLEGFVERFGAGAQFEAHEVAISSGTTLAGATSSTLVAVLHWSAESVQSYRPQRLGPGVPLYDWGAVAHERVAP